MKEIAVATSTLYPNWQDYEELMPTPEKVRGDLALKTIEKARDKGFQIVVVDGGSSGAFLDKLSSFGVKVSNQIIKGMSPGRQQSFREASKLIGVKVIAWTEPEKLSVVEGCLEDSAAPILKGEADIVVPKRNEAAFASYPLYQAESEKKANKLWNDLLKEANLLPQESQDLDIFFGPKLFRNNSEILDIFVTGYQYTKPDKPDLDLWPNAIIFPIISALKKGFRVESVPVFYTHPKEQTQIELDNPEFHKKRILQFENVLGSTSDFIQYLKGDSNSHIRKIV